eukprot:7445357-Pyramimonas_sp.AAC.1
MRIQAPHLHCTTAVLHAPQRGRPAAERQAWWDGAVEILGRCHCEFRLMDASARIDTKVGEPPYSGSEGPPSKTDESGNRLVDLCLREKMYLISTLRGDITDWTYTDGSAVHRTYSIAMNAQGFDSTS